MTAIPPAECSSCGAPIIWATTPAGAASPIDAYVNTEKGNVLLLAPKGMGQLLAIVLTKDALKKARETRMPLRLSHWATCPDRVEHRNRADERRAKA